MRSKVRGLKISFLIVFTVMIAMSLFWMAYNGKVGKITLRVASEDSIVSFSLHPQDATEDIVEIIDHREIPGGIVIRIRALKPGSEWYTLFFEQSSGGGTEMFRISAGRSGFLWIDYVPQGSEMLAGACLIGIVMLLILLCFTFHASELDTPYSYRLSAVGGMILFTVFALITNIVLLINSLRGGAMLTVDSIIVQLSRMPAVINRVILPILIIAFAAISVSNVSLLIHEGRRMKNLLGAILGALLTLGALTGIALQSQFMQRLFGFGAMQNCILYGLQFFFCDILCYVECLTASIVVHAVKAARHQPSMDRDYIVILGCTIGKDGRLYPLIRGRVDRALRFAEEQFEKTGKAAVLVPSGGKGSDECMSEAEAMQAYLLQQGLPQEQILPETCSENTWQNMQFSKALIEQRNASAKIAFSTTNYHVLRAGIYASEVGLHADGMGSKTKWYYWPNAFARELVALFINRRKQHLLIAGIILLSSILLCAAMYIMIM